MKGHGGAQANRGQGVPAANTASSQPHLADFLPSMKGSITMPYEHLRCLRDSDSVLWRLLSRISRSHIQLYTLETALLRVKRLELDDPQHAEVVALRQAASQCQRTIDAFWEKIRKYQPSLREGGSGSRAKDAWCKVKWAICKKDDLVKFKADLMGHTQSIELLLTTVQMAASRIDGKSAQSNHRSLVGKIQDSYFGCMQRMTVVLEHVSTGIQQGKQLLEMTAKVIQTNVEIFKVILEIQTIITRIPGQVDRQQPVFLVDAIGRHTPFHLEFITCADSLTVVLKNNFRKIGSGSNKIEKGEFAIQDSATHRDIDLTSTWETCFFPGQKVDMSMLFVTNKSVTNCCPKYNAKATPNIESQEDIQCARCGMIYRSTSIIQLVSPEPDEILSQSPVRAPTLPADQELNDERRRTQPKATSDEEDEIVLFKRVRITHKTLMKLPKPNSRPGSPISTTLALDFSIASTREPKWDWQPHLPKMKELYDLGISISDIHQAIRCEGFEPSLRAVYNLFRFLGYPTDPVGRTRLLDPMSSHTSETQHGELIDDIKFHKSTYHQLSNLYKNIPPPIAKSASGFESPNQGFNTRTIQDRAEEIDLNNFLKELQNHDGFGERSAVIRESDFKNGNEADGDDLDEDKDEEEYEDQYDSDYEIGDTAQLPSSNHERTEADFWIPQATPDGRLFYFNTRTGESSTELPLESTPSPKRMDESNLQAEVPSTPTFPKAASPASPPPAAVEDRWAQIRKNAAVRAAVRKSEDHTRRANGDDMETSEEETIETRVARIKARVAELMNT